MNEKFIGTVLNARRFLDRVTYSELPRYVSKRNLMLIP